MVVVVAAGGVLEAAGGVLEAGLSSRWSCADRGKAALFCLWADSSEKYV